MEDKNKLNDKQLEGAKGGYLFYNQDKYVEVIDEDGEVVYTSKTFASAEDYARKHGYSTQSIIWKTVERLREEAKKRKEQQ